MQKKTATTKIGEELRNGNDEKEKTTTEYNSKKRWQKIGSTSHTRARTFVWMEDESAPKKSQREENIRKRLPQEMNPMCVRNIIGIKH